MGNAYMRSPLSWISWAAPALTSWRRGAGPLSIQVALPVLLLAGLLAGFRSRLSSGCTSGHRIMLLVALFAGALFGLRLAVPGI